MLASPDARVRPFDPAIRTLHAPDAETHAVTTSDGVELRLTRYRAGSRGPVLLAHGLAVSSRIFTTKTIATNLLEFLCAHGFDVWLLDLRVSIDLPSSALPSTGDDVALKDFPAALAKVRSVTGARHVDALVHCYGATTLFMAMLAGLEGVRSIVCSQVATHAVSGWRIRTEASLRLATLMRLAGVGAMSARPGERLSVFHRAYDAGLALMPQAPHERCDSAACRRISFLYGRLYQHNQLTPATHAALPDLFGVASLAALEHIGVMMRRRQIVDARGRDEYLPHIDRLALPITFIHGALNACYLPVSTEQTFDALSAAHGASLYERHVVPRYGHIDCIFGKNAALDVYPLMLRHFDRVGS